MSEYPVTTAQDFKEFVSVTDRKGDQAIVIGGHAVSLWGLYYLHSEPELRKLAPFTSKDMDFLGDRAIALSFARMVNEPAERAPKTERTPVIYRIKRLFPNTERQNSTLEVLSHLPGVSNREIKETAMLIYSEALETRVRLPNPITCLKAKAHNLVRINQEKRQDHRQVKIMILCCRAFLRDVIEQAESGKITEGAARAPFEALLKWSKSVTAHKAASIHALRWSDAFPLTELQRSFVPSLQQFLRKYQRAGIQARPTDSLRNAAARSKRQRLLTSKVRAEGKQKLYRGAGRSYRDLEPSRNGLPPRRR
jgi:hypothetical protein